MQREQPALWPCGTRGYYVMRVLIRVGYGLAPVVVLGAVALSTGGGRHRLMVLALAVLIGVILGTTADGAGLKGRFNLRSGNAAGDQEAPAAER
jgi:hypothetical protein